MANVGPTRIRVKSASPLQEFRIWITIPQNIKTIGDLKGHICGNVRFLESFKSQVVLELEDYELLDDSPINLLRDDDILALKCTTTPSGKRKAESEQQASPDSHRKKRKLSTRFISRSSSTSTTSTSSSAASSTDSTTGTDSASAESSSSAASSVGTLQRGMHLPTQQNHLRTTFKQSQPDRLPVPPGLGKSSTHARNRRRKLKRQYGKQQAQNVGEDTNLKQAGDDNRAVQESIVHDDLPFFPTSQNHQEITLKEFDNVSRFSTTFIPPSERYPLPPNVYVTTIDVEDSTYQDHSALQGEIQVEELSYGAPLDWDAIDKDWDTFSKVTASTPLSTGMIIGWRAFGLNPSTLTPEMTLLHLGRIAGCISDNIRIAVISRGTASFGGVVDEEEPEELTRLKENIISEEWRLVNHV